MCAFNVYIYNFKILYKDLGAQANFTAYIISCIPALDFMQHCPKRQRPIPHMQRPKDSVLTATLQWQKLVMMRMIRHHVPQWAAWMLLWQAIDTMIMREDRGDMPNTATWLAILDTLHIDYSSAVALDNE